MFDGWRYLPGTFSNIKGSVRARAINRKKTSSAGWVSVSSYGSFLGGRFVFLGGGGEDGGLRPMSAPYACRIQLRDSNQ